MAGQLDLAIRTALPTDMDFIYATWLRGLHGGNTLFKKIPPKIYFQNYSKILEKILSKSSITIACFKDEPNVFLGYAVFNDTTLHWVYVKRDWRKKGIAKKLLPLSINQYTHSTTLSDSISREKEYRWVFNPFAL